MRRWSLGGAGPAQPSPARGQISTACRTWRTGRRHSWSSTAAWSRAGAIRAAAAAAAYIWLSRAQSTSGKKGANDKKAAVKQAVQELVARAAPLIAELRKAKKAAGPKIIVLTGGPGVGKTTLLEDLKAKLIPAYDSAFDRVPEVFETHAADGAKLVG